MNRTIFGATDEFNFPYIDIGLSNDSNVRVKAKAIIDTGAAHCLVIVRAFSVSGRYCFLLLS